MSCCPNVFSRCIRLRGTWRVSKANDDTTPLHDLVLHPSAIDKKLNSLICDWQSAILEYENLELAFLEECEARRVTNASEILSEMKADPRVFLRGSELLKNWPVLLDLTRLCLKVQDLQAQLPLQRERNDATLPRDDSLNVYDADSPAKAVDGAFLKKLSSTWSTRLNAVDATQGAVLVKRGDQPLQLRPRWPRYLADISYDVIKVNKFGQKMRRVLRLTQHHVISLKDGAALTKFYPYRDVRRAFLAAQTTLKIVQRDGKINTYLSPIALHIFQQIVTRVKIRKALDAAALDLLPQRSSPVEGSAEADVDTAAAADFTPQATATIIAAISEANSNSADEVLTLFARELAERTILGLRQDAARADEAGEAQSSAQDDAGADAPASAEPSDAAPAAPPTSTGDEPPPPPPVAASLSPTASPALSASPEKSLRLVQATLRMTYPAESAEGAVQTQVRALLFDSDTPENSTLLHFLRSVNDAASSLPLKSTLLKVRHFIDGLHEYCLESRGFALAALYRQQVQRRLTQAAAAAESSDAGGALSPQLTSRASLRFLRENDLGLAHVDAETLTLLSLVIFLAVEEVVFLSLRSLLVRLYHAEEPSRRAQELCLQRHVKALRARSQEAWGVPPQLVSPLGWRSAAFELAALEHNLTPSVQLQVLTRTFKSIYHEFKFALLPRLGDGTHCIAADDLVPIFLFVFCQTPSLRHCLQNRDFMWGLGHPDQLRGEAGYFLTVYESALECVLQDTGIEGGASTRFSSVGSRSGSSRYSVDSQADAPKVRLSFSQAALGLLRRFSRSDPTGPSEGGQGGRASSLSLSSRSRTSSSGSASGAVDNPLLRALRLPESQDLVRESFA